jgi:hypothetical protein
MLPEPRPPVNGAYGPFDRHRARCGPGPGRRLADVGNRGGRGVAFLARRCVPAPMDGPARATIVARAPPQDGARRAPTSAAPPRWSELTTALIVAGDAGIGIVFGAAVAAIALAIAILGCPRGE